MKIIVGTDFSPAAENAARTAAALARKLGDELVLLRVIEPPAVIYPELSVAGTEAMELSLRQGVEAQVSTAAAALRSQGLAVTERVLFGVPDQVLVSQAQEPDVRLLVMGTHGRRGLARFFMGSVAERTVLDSPRPVIVVRADEPQLQQWAEGNRPLRILVGVDVGPGTDAALEWLRNLRRIAPCDVVLVHNYWPPREYTRLGFQGPRDVFATDPEVATALERELRRFYGDLPGEGGVRFLVRAAWGPPGEALAEQAVEEKADLVIVGTQQPHGWQRVKTGSVAVSTIRAAHVPVLCVPAVARAARVPSTTATIPALRTVLAATDFSPLGDSSVAHACALLRATGGTLELCHVRERKLPTPIYTYEAKEDALTPSEKAEIERRLLGLVPPEAERLGITVHTTVIDGGEPAPGILQAARRVAADAICMASHGRTGLRRAVLGSVAQAVMAGAERPVYVVRTPS